MHHSIHRAVLNLAVLTVLVYPAIVFAEVSDKEPSTALFWKISPAAAITCLVGARMNRGSVSSSYYPPQYGLRTYSWLDGIFGIFDTKRGLKSNPDFIPAIVWTQYKVTPYAGF